MAHILRIAALAVLLCAFGSARAQEAPEPNLDTQPYYCTGNAYVSGTVDSAGACVALIADYWRQAKVYLSGEKSYRTNLVKDGVLWSWAREQTIRIDFSSGSTSYGSVVNPVTCPSGFLARGDFDYQAREYKFSCIPIEKQCKQGLKDRFSFFGGWVKRNQSGGWVSDGGQRLDFVDGPHDAPGVYCDGSCNWVSDGVGSYSYDFDAATNGYHKSIVSSEYISTGGKCSVKTEVPSKRPPPAEPNGEGGGKDGGGKDGGGKGGGGGGGGGGKDGGGKDSGGKDGGGKDGGGKDGGGKDGGGKDGGGKDGGGKDGGGKDGDGKDGGGKDGGGKDGGGKDGGGKDGGGKDGGGKDGGEKDGGGKDGSGKDSGGKDGGGKDGGGKDGGGKDGGGKDGGGKDGGGKDGSGKDGGGKGGGGKGGSGECEGPDCEEKGSFSGNCAGGFSCKGDALLCAIAREQHRRACQFFEERDSEPYKLYEREKNKEGSVLGNLKGNKSVDISDYLDGSDEFIGGGGCPADRRISFGYGEVVIPYSLLCPWFVMFGNVLVVCAAIVGARIILRKET